MVDLTKGLALIGVVFIIFSLFGLEAWFRRGEAEGKEVMAGAMWALWFLIALFGGLILVAWALFGGVPLLLGWLGMFGKMEVRS